MGLYDKYARLAGERLQFSDNGLTPFGTCIDEVYSATEGRIGNKKVILAGTNNYLGLTFNHDAISEGQAALAARYRHHRFSYGKRQLCAAPGVRERDCRVFQSPYRYRFFNRLYR